jgi:hypothetical protein
VLRNRQGDTIPAADVRVVLHRLRQGSAGPLDSMRVDPRGRFEFRVTADTGSIFLLSARWAGIEYFSQPLAGRFPSQFEGIRLLVSDTSSRAPVRVLGRYLIVGAPDADRTRTVVDLFVLRNPGPATRVAPDTLTPTWRHVLPGGTAGHSSGPASEFSDEAMRFAGDTVMIFSPISPGADRHLMVQHTLPAAARSLRVPLGEGADSVQVVTEEEGLSVEGLAQVGSQIIDGKPLARWAGQRSGLPAAGGLVIRFPREAANLEGVLVPLLAGLTVVVMLGAGWHAWRRATPLPAPARSPADELLERIARLDSAHRGRPLSDAEREAYTAERKRLKEALTTALAGRMAPR